MSDIADPQAPSPFRPAPIAPPSSGGGCRKAVFAGCGGLLVLLLVCIVFFVFKAPALFQWWLALVERKITAVAPADLTPEDRAALHQGFADLGGVLTHGGQPDARFLQPFQTELMQILSKPKGQVSRQEILDLTRILEKTAGKHAPEPPSESAPPAAPVPGPAPPMAPPSRT